MGVRCSIIIYIRYKGGIDVSTAGVNGFRTDRLAEMREERGLTKVEAARRMHLSLSGYTNFERGERTPSWQTVFTMALVLGTSTGYLTGETDDPSPEYVLMPIRENDSLSELAPFFQRLTEEERDAVAVVVKTMAAGRDDGNG